MAKKRKKRYKDDERRVQRDTSDITRLRKLLYSPFLVKKPEVKRKREAIPDDRRYFRPEMDRAIRKVDGTYAKIVLAHRTRNRPSKGTKVRIAFADPRYVTVCRRRKERRESLFKSGKIGKGKKIFGRKRITEASRIKC